MDGNKDEALKCLKIGQEALELGDRTRALKFITKARRLDPTLPVDDLLSKLEGKSGDAPAPDSSSPNGVFPEEAKPPANSSVRHRGSSNGSSSTSSVSYTEEQISIVRQIKRKKEYYDILGVEKECSVEDVRKAYRKLSLKVHPDKNKAPGAEEAFKAVSKAFQCLSDEESRKRYDLVGSDEAVYDRPAARRAPQGFNGFYEADVDAEEIFRNFFFGGMPRATTQFGGFTFGTGTGPSVHTADHGSGNFNIRALLQLLPILLLLLLNFLPSSDPIYALSQSYAYEHRFVTQKGVNYFVRTAKFDQEYPPNSPGRVEIEQQVERTYRSSLSQYCQVELQRRQWGFTIETPHCDRLREFQAMA
ncbi:chaperone protein dnaJ 49-like [Telopea speciosissima]|uniref:chaperone protein dnaJ 49-like n=1 Tax=Telopea speciosissima TaxID=54955 RepID=UPI001CC6F813|nr:chaperone protein dnaJ 49-like [Telopea speciosissima]XP_043699694.1 chaperone protein dnaJ 49-like [Telopea speciosissima]XP_043699695.1 chaperone protein dnaJ 49-like [Telopea speciosissima]XP_043699696.1 chaperone protein dnaJ 49-like [Telopea speciosissima]